MKNRVVLLVEDNPKDEMLTQRALRKSQLSNEVVVARDGAEALDYLLSAQESPQSEVQGDLQSDPQNGPPQNDLGQLPAVVFLDLKLPKINGLEVLQRIRSDERTHHLPVVILTSSDEENDIVSSYASGANSYVRKPVEIAEFDEAIGQMGHYWGQLNESPPPKKSTK
jgi:CheY-like chemotaxis protein